MKGKYFVIAFVLMAIVVAACSTSSLTPEEKAAQKMRIAEAVASAIDNRRFKVEVNYMKPFRGPNRHLSFGYEIRVSGDTLYSYLPYFGAAYNVPYGGGKGLNWDAPLTGYQVSAGRKGATIVEMTAYNGEDYFLYSLELMPNGTAYLNVRSRDREPISFSGDIELRTD